MFLLDRNHITVHCIGAGAASKLWSLRPGHYVDATPGSSWLPISQSWRIELYRIAVHPAEEDPRLSSGSYY